MLDMRAALRILCMQCVLLSGTTLAADVAPGAAAQPASVAAAPAAAPASTTVPSIREPIASSRGVSADQPTAAEAGLPAPPGTSAGSALSPGDLLFASPTTLDQLGRVVAAVMVDGKGPFRFIVDTGANHSTISPQLAALLGLRPSLAQPIRITGITGSAEVASVPIEMLRAGDLEIASTRFPVIWSSVMAGAAGILGAAGLTDDRLIVDFDHDQVRITRSHGDSFPWGFTRVWATRLPGGLLSVPGRVGDVPVQAIIDTGSQHTLGNLALYRELFEHEQGKGKYFDADVYGATRQVGMGKLQIAPLLDLGAIKIDGIALVFGDFHIFRAWDLTREPTIILGMDVLGTVRAFAVDFRYGEIGFETRTQFQTATRSALGCRFSTGAASFGCGD
ncbi:MAG: aspartyl protease family protein [Steroidobacteraceae bacterium]